MMLEKLIACLSVYRFLYATWCDAEGLLHGQRIDCSTHAHPRSANATHNDSVDVINPLLTHLATPSGCTVAKYLWHLYRAAVCEAKQKAILSLSSSVLLSHRCNSCCYIFIILLTWQPAVARFLSQPPFSGTLCQTTCSLHRLSLSSGDS